MDITIGEGWWTRPYALSLAGSSLQASWGKPLVSTVGKEGSAAEADHFMDYALRILRDAEYWVKRWHGSELTGVYLSLKGDRWLCTIKATHKGEQLVAFISAETLADTIISMAYALGHKSLQWRKNKPFVSE